MAEMDQQDYEALAARMQIIRDWDAEADQAEESWLELSLRLEE